MFYRAILIVIPILRRELPWCHIKYNIYYMQNNNLLPIQSIQRC